LRPSCCLCLRHQTKKQNKIQKRVIFYLITVSNHISILKRKKKERERGIS